MLLHTHQHFHLAWFWLLQHNTLFPESKHSAHLLTDSDSGTGTDSEQSCMPDAGRRGEGAGDEAAGGCEVSAGNEDGSEGSRGGEDQA